MNAEALSRWLPYAFETTESGGGIAWSCNPWGNDFGRIYQRTSPPRTGLLLLYGICFGICIDKDMDLDLLRTRLGGVCDDIERTCRVYDLRPPIYQFPQLIVSKSGKRKPGSFLKGAGGQSSAFKTNQQHISAKKNHLGLIASEFPRYLEILSKPSKKGHWKLFNFRKVVARPLESEGYAPEPKQCMGCAELQKSVQMQVCPMLFVLCLMVLSMYAWGYVVCVLVYLWMSNG